MTPCELCTTPGGELVWEDALCRVVLVGGSDGAAFPGFCRVIWRQHVHEMSDLPAQERRHFMSIVFATEAAVRERAQPDKINLASLGNVVPHLHWHVIPRWIDDSHFPAPIWATAKRRVPVREVLAANDIRLALLASLAEERGGGIA